MTQQIELNFEKTVDHAQKIVSYGFLSEKSQTNERPLQSRYFDSITFDE